MIRVEFYELRRERHLATIRANITFPDGQTRSVKVGFVHHPDGSPSEPILVGGEPVIDPLVAAEARRWRDQNADRIRAVFAST